MPGRGDFIVSSRLSIPCARGTGSSSGEHATVEQPEPLPLPTDPLVRVGDVVDFVSKNSTILRRGTVTSLWPEKSRCFITADPEIGKPREFRVWTWDIVEILGAEEPRCVEPFDVVRFLQHGGARVWFGKVATVRQSQVVLVGWQMLTPKFYNPLLSEIRRVYRDGKEIARSHGVVPELTEEERRVLAIDLLVEDIVDRADVELRTRRTLPTPEEIDICLGDEVAYEANKGVVRIGEVQLLTPASHGTRKETVTVRVKPQGHYTAYDARPKTSRILWVRRDGNVIAARPDAAEQAQEVA